MRRLRVEMIIVLVGFILSLPTIAKSYYHPQFLKPLTFLKMAMLKLLIFDILLFLAH